MTDAQTPDNWRLVDGSLVAWFEATSHAAGASLLGQALEIDPGLDADLRSVGVLLSLDPADTAAAKRISVVASSLGLTCDPSVPSRLSVVVEAQDTGAVRDFWRTVTAYLPHEDSLRDPLRRNPALRLVETDERRPLRNRLHLDVSRPHELAHEAIAAVAPGAGRTGETWAFYATVPDPEGNEVDLVPLAAADRISEEEGTADWRALFGAMAHYPVDGAGAAAELITAVADLADAAGVPLLVDVRPGGVTIDSGKDLWEEDDRFAALAVRVQAAARGLGLVADPSLLRYLQVGIDAVDVPAVREFWRAVLGYADDSREGITDVYDPRRLGAVLFFQPMSEDDTDRRRQRNRMHLELSVAADQVQARVDVALANGGSVLHADGPAGRWTLTDPEGNELHLRAP